MTLRKEASKRSLHHQLHAPKGQSHQLSASRTLLSIENPFEISSSQTKFRSITHFSSLLISQNKNNRFPKLEIAFLSYHLLFKISDLIFLICKIKITVIYVIIFSFM